MSNIGLIQLYAGNAIPPLQRIKSFSPYEWEEFVEEWLSAKIDTYVESERLGGAGDQGRDVIGYISCPKKFPNNYEWDNFQCKHYDHPLRPSDVWSEFGKVCYYSYCGDFPPPKNYYFVAPQGVGTSLSALLRDPEKLKKELKNNWDKYCKEKITKKKDISLSGNFLTYVDTFDFSIFDKVKPLTLIEEHSETRFHLARFGGGFPKRPEIEEIPKDIELSELIYVSKLLDAYGEADSCNYPTPSSLPLRSRADKHFKRARKHFYKAEQLKQFSRDKLPAGVFETYTTEIASGVINILEDDQVHGFARVKAVEQEARKLSITSNTLSLCSDGDDRVGVCHHLANDKDEDNDFVWVSDNA